MWHRERKSVYSEMMEHLGALLILNLLWFISCLPVITIGAATAAMEGVIFDILDEDRTDIIGKYWRHLKAVFCPAAVLWLFFLFAAADLVLLGSMAGVTSLEKLLNSPVKSAAAVLLAMVYGLVVNWAFPLVAYGKKKGLMEVLKTAFSLAVLYPGKTFLCMGIVVFMVTLSILCPLVLLGVAGCTAYLTCRVMRPVIKRASDSAWEEPWEPSWEEYT